MKHLILGMVATLTGLTFTADMQAHGPRGGYHGCQPSSSYCRPQGHGPQGGYCQPYIGYQGNGYSGNGYVCNGYYVKGNVYNGNGYNGNGYNGNGYGKPIYQAPVPVQNGGESYPLLECYLALKNTCPHDVTVYLQYRSQLQGQSWAWVPGQPGGNAVLAVTVPAGKTVDVLHNGRRLAASRIRIWMNGWEEFRLKDYWLVTEQDENGYRRYFAPSLQTHTVVLPVVNGPSIPVQASPVGPVQQPGQQPVNPQPPVPNTNTPVQGTTPGTDYIPDA